MTRDEQYVVRVVGDLSEPIRRIQEFTDLFREELVSSGFRNLVGVDLKLPSLDTITMTKLIEATSNRKSEPNYIHGYFLVLTENLSPAMNELDVLNKGGWNLVCVTTLTDDLMIFFVRKQDE